MYRVSIKKSKQIKRYFFYFNPDLFCTLRIKKKEKKRKSYL